MDAVEALQRIRDLLQGASESRDIRAIEEAVSRAQEIIHQALPSMPPRENRGD
jgi:hypothetical protein